MAQLALQPADKNALPTPSNGSSAGLAARPANTGAVGTSANSISGATGNAGAASSPGAASDDALADGRDGKAQRELDKKRKTEYRRLLRREEDLIGQSDRLDADIASLREDMAQPANYSDGQRMKQLQQRLEQLEQSAATVAAEWEKVAAELEQYADLATSA